MNSRAKLSITVSVASDMLSALIIMWLYVSGGIAIYALATDLGEDDDWLIYGVVFWPVMVTVCIAAGLLDMVLNFIVRLRGVIGK